MHHMRGRVPSSRILPGESGGTGRGGRGDPVARCHSGGCRRRLGALHEGGVLECMVFLGLGEFFIP